MQLELIKEKNPTEIYLVLGWTHQPLAQVHHHRELSNTHHQGTLAMAHRETDLQIAMILCTVLHQMKENRKNFRILFSWMKRQNQKHQNTVWVRPAAPNPFQVSLAKIRCLWKR